MTPLRIALVSLYFPPMVRGGAHLSAYFLAKGLAGRGHRVDVFTSQRPRAADRTSGEAAWQHPGITVHPALPVLRPTTAMGMDRASLVMAWSLRQHLRKHRLSFDVLHAYGMDTIPAVVFSRPYGRAVATFNGYWATCPHWDHTDPSTRQLCAVCGYRHLARCILGRDGRRDLFRFAAKWHYLYLSLRFRQVFSRRLDLLLPISQSMKRILIANRFPAGRMRVCYNMVDLADYGTLDRQFLHRRFGIDPARPILLHAGRFAPYKGTEFILDAIPSIVERHPEVHFVFIGQGSTMKGLETRARRNGLAAATTFGGFVDPALMPSAYASAYAVLHTATWPEPFARGPVESLAAGTPVIATATGGTPEIVRDGETGLLIPPFDADAIARAADRLLDNRSLRDNLGAAGRSEVHSRFAIDGQIEQYLAAYRELL